MRDFDGFPTLGSLSAFEAAVKTGSFTGAADLLGVGQPAISHAIRQLEDDLGVELFQRLHRGVEPTEAGWLLVAHVRRGLDAIEDGLAEVRRLAGEPETVVVGASTATAAYWLIPRLAQLKLQHPEVDVRCVTSDTNTFDMSALDLFIPVGLGSWPGPRWVVAREVVYPICSTAYAETLGSLPLSLNNLAALPLLHLEEKHRSRLTWEQWFAGAGGAQSPRLLAAGGPTLANDYTVLLHAVQAGNGIALGWDHIVAPLVADGSLVRPVEVEVVTGRPIHLHATRSAPRSEGVESVRRWLTASSPVGEI